MLKRNCLLPELDFLQKKKKKVLKICILSFSFKIYQFKKAGQFFLLRYIYFGQWTPFPSYIFHEKNLNVDFGCRDDFDSPQVALAYMQHAWSTGQKRLACLHLEHFLTKIKTDPGQSITAYIAAQMCLFKGFTPPPCLTTGLV